MRSVRGTDYVGHCALKEGNPPRLVPAVQPSFQFFADIVPPRISLRISRKMADVIPRSTLGMLYVLSPALITTKLPSWEYNFSWFIVFHVVLWLG